MDENESLQDGRKRKLSREGLDEENHGTREKGRETTETKGKTETECNVENIDESGNDKQTKPGNDYKCWNRRKHTHRSRRTSQHVLILFLLFFNGHMSNDNHMF